LNPEAELIRLDDDGSLRIEVGEVCFFIAEDDVESLVSSGSVAPVSKPLPGTESSFSIEGHAAISSGGKAVKIFTTSGHFIIPLVSLRRVVKGEAVSAPLFPLEPDLPEGRQ